MGDKIFTAISVLIYLLALGALTYAILIIFRYIQI
jgi:hypothetical protein